MFRSTSVELQKNILVVDDSSVLRCAYKQVLQGWGYDVDIAEDGLEGIRLLRKGKYHLVLTDYEMPNCDGVEFMHCARAQKDEIGDIPFVLLTGTPLELLGKRLEGFAYTLTKPAGVKALKDVLAYVFANH